MLSLILIATFLVFAFLAVILYRNYSRSRDNQRDTFASFEKIFEGLGQEDLERIWQGATRETFVKGEPVFAQGDTVDRCYLILSGKISISKDTEELGKDIQLAVIGAGDIFGEFSYAGLSNDNRRMAHATALKTSKCLSLSSSEIDEIAHQSATASNEAFSVLSQLRDIASKRSLENETTLGWAKVFRDPNYGAFKK